MKRFVQDLTINLRKREFWILQTLNLSVIVKGLSFAVFYVMSYLLIALLGEYGIREFFKSLHFITEAEILAHQLVTRSLLTIIKIMILVYPIWIAFSYFLSFKKKLIRSALKQIGTCLLLIIILNYLEAHEMHHHQIEVIIQHTFKYYLYGLSVFGLTLGYKKVMLNWLNQRVFAYDQMQLKEMELNEGYKNTETYIKINEPWQDYLSLESKSLLRITEKGQIRQQLQLLYRMKYMSDNFVFTLGRVLNEQDTIHK